MENPILQNVEQLIEEMAETNRKVLKGAEILMNISDIDVATTAKDLVYEEDRMRLFHYKPVVKKPCPVPLQPRRRPREWPRSSEEPRLSLGPPQAAAKNRVRQLSPGGSLAFGRRASHTALREPIDPAGRRKHEHVCVATTSPQKR